MATLLLRLVGPMQSWGITSRFDERDTGKEPSKSAVTGLLAAAMGIDRESWDGLKALAQMKMAVRHDRPGILKQDYQTVGCAQSNEIIKADGKPSKDGIISKRYYLADAAFLVGLESDDCQFLESIQKALQNPVWIQYLGRKSYLPSEPTWFKEGVQNGSLQQVLPQWPWISTLRKHERYPQKLLMSRESEKSEGVLKMDLPVSSFSLRQFAGRYVISEWIPFPQEVSHVSP